MEVILLERVHKLGMMGDVVTVKNGFGRNYLLPQKKALRATEANKALFESQKRQLEADNLKRREEAEKVAQKMDGLKLYVVRQASEKGHLYGSVTAKDLATSIGEAGFTVDRRQIHIEPPIKEVGIHAVQVALHPEVTLEVKVHVAQTMEEARNLEALGQKKLAEATALVVEELDVFETIEAVEGSSSEVETA